MATLNGFKLTLPNNDVYSGKGNLRIGHTTQGNFLVGGQGGGGLIDTGITYLGEYVAGGGASGVADGLNQNLAILPHGSHLIEIGFQKWEGETGESWGGTADSADPIQKLQALNDAIQQERIDSTDPATLEVGEYHTNGTYDPLPVAIANAELRFEAAEEASTFTGTLTFFEVTDLAEEIDAVTPGTATTGNLTITPADATTPKLELSADSFRRGRRTREAEVNTRGLSLDGAAGDYASAEKLGPGEFEIEGLFRGSKAKSAAERLRNDFIDNHDVGEIDIKVQGVTNPLEEGTYAIQNGEAVRVHQETDKLFKWWLRLAEI